jgi:hypothetical protein
MIAKNAHIQEDGNAGREKKKKKRMNVKRSHSESLHTDHRGGRSKERQPENS